jgi:hypothetical protein
MVHHEAMFRNAGTLPKCFGYKELRDLADRSVPGISHPGKTFSCLRFIQKFCTDYTGAHARFYQLGDPRRYDRLAELKKCVFSLTRADNEIVRQAMTVEGAQFENSLFDFLATRLEARNPEYFWRFGLRRHYPWLHERYSSGRSLSDASSTLAIAGNELARALDHRDEDRCLEAVSVIMDLGKVYYAIGPRKHNQPTVEKLHASGALPIVLQQHIDLLKAGEHQGVTHMNSGWNRVWACLAPDAIMALDSRISVALGRVFQEYSLDTKMALRVVSERVGFYQVGFPGRTVDGIPKVDKRPEVWALSSMHLSGFMLKFLQFCRKNNRHILNGYPFSLRGLEAKLFMMGE